MSDLVGRDPELAAVAAWLDAAAGGAGTVALVSGEPGIGKTRFLEETAALARQRGFAVAWGRAWEVSSAPPYWPWIEALRELVARPGDDAATARLVAVLPELDRARGGERAKTAHADPIALYDAVVGYLQAAAARGPIAVVLDDLHAADPSSVALAVRVAPHLRRMRAVVVGSYRDVEARLAPAIEAGLVKLGRHGEILALRPLDAAGVGALFRAATGRDDPEVARMIHEASDGNPLFVRELLRLLAARGAVAPGASMVPAGVRAVIRERLVLLSPATVALLQAAAVVGRTFGLAVAAEVGGVTPAVLEDAIGEAAATDLVAPAEPGRFRFSHALVAETLAAELAPAVRAKLHRRAAETIERHRAGDPAPLAEIARHWLGAGADAAGTAVVAAERAAEAAEATIAFADAAQLYEQALAALALAEPGSARRRAELLIRQGQAWVRAGERDRARAPCVAAAELARGLADGALFARAALAYGADVAVATIDRVLVRLLEEALEILPTGDDAWRAAVMARLAAARQPDADPHQPIALALEAVAMARRIGDARVVHDVTFAAIGALTDFARPEVRAPLNAEVARFAAAAGDRARHLRSLQRLAFDRVDLCDLTGFDHAVAEYEAIATELGQPRYQWVPLMFRSMRALWQGAYATAEALADEAFAIRDRLGDAMAAATRTVRRSMNDSFRDPRELDHIAHGMTQGHEAFERALRGWAHARNRRLTEARVELDWFHAQPETNLHYHAYEMMGQLAWTMRDRRIALALYDRVLEDRGRPLMVTSLAFIVVGIADHELMRAAAVLERWDDVDRHAEDALAICARLGARPLAAQIRAEWAEALLDRGGAVERARELATAARTVATELALWEVELTCDGVEARLAGVPAATPVAATPTGVVIACTREGEFWTVAGRGELCRIKDSRGMQMLARLIESPGRELHALDLDGADAAVDGGDAGPALDRDARAAYRARLDELRADLAEAEAWNDAGRRERTEDEIDALTAELAGAYGLGGRERRTGAASERARQNVRRRLADAMKRIGDACPGLGRHLAAAVRTGTTCSYDPERSG